MWGATGRGEGSTCRATENGKWVRKLKQVMCVKGNIGKGAPQEQVLGIHSGEVARRQMKRGEPESNGEKKKQKIRTMETNRRVKKSVQGGKGEGAAQLSGNCVLTRKKNSACSRSGKRGVAHRAAKG